jgi:hypothetical protein
VTPWAPSRACTRCRGAHRRGEVCPQDAARQRENANFFNSAAWKQLRARKLALNPSCECETCRANGLQTPAVDVDHVLSRARAPHLALTFSNLRSLSHGHHSRKTATEDMRGRG